MSLLPKLPFLYEDNHVLGVDKPPGILSQGDLTGDVDVLSLAKRLIKKRDDKPGKVYLGLVHRLDRPVGGAMIIAKTSKAAARLSRQFRERSTQKVYRAVVQGNPPDGGDLEHALLKDRAARVTRVVSPQTQGAKVARLSYKVIERRGDRALVEVDLYTGLPHQIRVQLAAVGHPIAGDRKYGSRISPEKAGTIALYSLRIAFAHPVGKHEVVVTADPPDSFPW